MLKPFRKIDIEFHSKCNRKCPWCPNKRLDRYSEDHIMDKELFIKILNDIKDNHFEESYVPTMNLSKTITFFGFQEPFLQINVLKEYVNIAYSILDNTIMLEASTNGDLLTAEGLNGLHLNKLKIMDYDCKGEEYWKKRMEELGCSYIYPQTSTEHLSFIHESVNLIQVYLNWTDNAMIEDRGGFLSREELQGYNLRNDMEERHWECPEMSFFMSIAYNGLVMPCCHMRFDNLNHQDYILGDLNKQTIAEILQSNKYQEIKSILQEPESNGIKGICSHCQKVRDTNLKGGADGYYYYCPKERELNV